MAFLGTQSVPFVLATGFGTTSACYVATSLTYCIIATGTEQTEAKAGNPQDSQVFSISFDCHTILPIHVCNHPTG